jgi:hypothetical protein
MRSMRLLLLSLIASCVSTKAAQLDPTLKLAPVCPDGVQMFTEASKVGKPTPKLRSSSPAGRATGHPKPA